MDERFLLTRPSRDVTANGAGLQGALTFLLTRPSRDVTIKMIELFETVLNFYSHAPRGT